MSNWQPAVSPQTLKARALLLTRIRGFMADRGLCEVETPHLSQAGNSDPGIEQYRLPSGHSLRSSPEYPMKRLLAAGSGDIYELGRVFRNLEQGRRHNPEFTLLEWYRLGWSWQQLAEEVCELVNHCGEILDRNWPHASVSYRGLLIEHTGIDPMLAQTNELRNCAERHGLDLAGSLDRDQWLDLLLSQVVQPKLPIDAMTVVFDFPASQAALARIRRDSPPVAERFEVFLGQVELANGYQELTDPEEQRMRFEKENDKQLAKGQQLAILDENLIAALQKGLPDCAGVALGVDRLLMACLGAKHIDEVIAFPFERA